MASLKTQHVIVYLVVAVVAVLVGLWAGSLTNDGSPPSAGVELKGGTALGYMHRAIPDVTLEDHNGATFDRSRLQDHWTLMFFGYTHCPDICPMALATLTATMPEIDKALPRESRQYPIQVVFVSVDPERDTPEQLKTYTTYFHPEFLGVTGPEQELATLTDALGILHVKVADPNNDQNYLIDHSASILVVNPAAELSAILSTPHSPPVIAADLATLVEHYPAR